MALFKIFKGNSSNLSSQQLKEGYCYVTTDEYKFYVDINDNLRVPLNAHQADTALTANVALAADKWSNARTITFTGDVTGSGTIDGSGNVSIPLTMGGAGTASTTYGNTSNKTLAHSGTFTVPYFSTDSKGRVTSGGNVTYTLPADNDTKNTAGSSNNSSTLYLIGATTQNANGVQTYSNSGNYISNGRLFTAGLKVLAAESHATSSTTYGLGTSSMYGHVKLSDSYTSINSISDGIASTPYATYLAYYNAKYQAGSSNTTSKIYLIGATSQNSRGQTTYSNSTVYIESNRVNAYGVNCSTTGGMWYKARESAAIKTATASDGAYIPAFSLKTSSGDWSAGVHESKLYFSYVTDTDYNNNTNSSNHTVRITNEGKLYGAVWNDYAEYRNQTEEIKPGYCVASTDDGKVYKTTEKFQACDGITSDTFGFAIGETDDCKTPLAVAGRVLAYCEGNRYDYHSGDTVCAGPHGKVVKMTREEIREWPDRIVGIVSEIPEYETWGSGNVAVDGRIWIKVK